jgi:ring-1,2-phenylacetyl-CoA epoxidase subunit PaaD
VADPENQQRCQPPADDEAIAASVACPFCGARDVELLGLFGSQLSTDQYYCRACRTPFERFSRDDEAASPTSY